LEGSALRSPDIPVNNLAPRVFRYPAIPEEGVSMTDLLETGTINRRRLFALAAGSALALALLPVAAIAKDGSGGGGSGGGSSGDNGSSGGSASSSRGSSGSDDGANHDVTEGVNEDVSDDNGLDGASSPSPTGLPNEPPKKKKHTS
jgi:hypothetical protein